MGITALFTGTTGLQANSSALDVIGNNLANLNTTGFKSQRTMFQDSLYQALSTGSPGNATTGGTNPEQVGFGVVVGSIGSQFSQGVVTPTGRSLDAAIQGAGYFVLANGNKTVFSRAGSFDIDANGYLVDPSTGFLVQRYGLVGDPTPTSPGFQIAGDNRIHVPFGAGAPGVPTANVNLQGNLSSTLVANDPANGTRTAAMQVFDSLSTSQTLTLTFSKTAANTFNLTATIPGATITYPDNLADPTQPPAPITFNTDGTIAGPTLADPTKAQLRLNVAGLPGTTPQDIILNLGTIGQAGGVTQFGGVSTIAAVTQDGLASGVLTAVSIDNGGSVQGQFSNGRTMALAQLAVAGFNNEGGLIRSGANYFTTGAGSGEAIVGVARDGGRGAVQGGALEGSNVDVATEFSRLIVAQRGFQVNAKTVTAVNETLQTLANIIQ